MTACCASSDTAASWGAVVPVWPSGLFLFANHKNLRGRTVSHGPVYLYDHYQNNKVERLFVSKLFHLIDKSTCPVGRTFLEEIIATILCFAYRRFKYFYTHH